jgi:hypothetical protein
LLRFHHSEFENERERALKWLDGVLSGEAEMPVVGLTVEEVSVLDGEEAAIQLTHSSERLVFLRNMTGKKL